MSRTFSPSFFASQTTHRNHAFVLGTLATVLLLLFFLGGFYSTPSIPLGHLHASSDPTLSQRAHQSTQNSTLGFERILAINLPERRDHRDGLILASAVSNFHVDFVDGVHGDTVLAKTLPALHTENMPAGAVGAWRAHINALSRVVENNWTTALILEDDVDWDIRLKQVLQDFAVSSDAILKNNSHGQIDFQDLPSHYAPRNSPYGSGWDVLWFGHCYMEINDDAGPIVLSTNDDTTPAIRHISTFDPEKVTPMQKYPEHTRAVFRHRGGVCSLAYAVSQAGARALLNELGLERFTEPFDLMLEHFCDGTYGMKRPHSCISVLPPIFDHHRAAGSTSKDTDIGTSDDSVRDKAFSPNIRWSVRLNMDKLLHGEDDYIDQYPD